MKQYIDLLKAIEAQGTDKPAARANMPGSRSLFGYQFRHDLSEGFPLLTTKKMYWKGIVAELLWFLRGDTNIKFLVDNGVNIWNGDAYKYYVKQASGNHSKWNVIMKHNPDDESQIPDPSYRMYHFDEFVNIIKNNKSSLPFVENYTLGDCGFQYGKVWRNWQGEGELKTEENQFFMEYHRIDQIRNVIKSLTKNPESRRHIVTAVDPAHDTDLALYWCHSMFQFNCRPLKDNERATLYYEVCPRDGGKITGPYGQIGRYETNHISSFILDEDEKEYCDSIGVPKYKLDCQLYQRSADSILGVPFNIASYALLTHIVAKLVNMVPGDFIHSFGDAHVYDNHKEALAEQLSREPGDLPRLIMAPEPFVNYKYGSDLDVILSHMRIDDFELIGYRPQPAIKAELSTG